MDLKVIVLAAGQGKRMNSESEQLPKVLRRACGHPLISYPLALLEQLPRRDVIVVTGFMSEKVRDTLGPEYSYALQAEQKGTGHAVQCALPALEGYSGPVLILYGDMPLLRRETVDGLIRQYEESGAKAVLLSADIKEGPLPAFGRIVRENGTFSRIVEDRDCTPEQKKITELNVGVYLFDAECLRRALSELRADNAQGELYLTDVPEILKKAGHPVEVYAIDSLEESMGVNTPEDLAEVERVVHARA